MEYVEMLEKENEELRLKLSTTQAKVERYEKALNDIVSAPRDWSESYSQAYPTCVKIALKALEK